jgi:hypothetical protein
VVLSGKVGGHDSDAASRLHPVELLLCGHHFRASRAALQGAGAAAYGKTGCQSS